MQKVLHETCVQYVARRLREGWRIIRQEGFSVILQSPEGIIRPIDLRNDILTLRPNADGSVIQLTPSSGTNNSAMVDESVADDDTTYVYTSTSASVDLYYYPDHTTESGTINSVNVFYRGRYTTHVANEIISGVVKIAGTIYVFSGADQMTATYVLYSATPKTTNPSTLAAWTWDEIDALEAGIKVTLSTGATLRCTQVYVEVDYTAVTVYDETGKLQVILAAQGETDIQAMVEMGKEVPILAVLDETDIQAMAETGKLQIVLAVPGEADVQTMQELGRLQVILSVLASTDVQAMSETAREQLILAVLGESESLTLDETARLQVLLAVVGESENLTLDEIGKLQVILGVLTSADIQIMQELGITQVVLAILASADAQTMSELGKLQEILAVVGEAETLALDETAREQIILSVLGESDIQAMVETAKLQLILAVIGKEEGRLLKSKRTTGKARVLDAIREENPERVLESKEVPH